MAVLSGSVMAVGVAVSSGLWTGLFAAAIRAQPRRSCAWNGRLVACIHGAVVSLLALVFGVACNPSPFTEPGGASNVYEVLIQVICLGYFLFDTVFCLRLNVYGHDTPILAVHHVMCIAAMVTSLCMGVSGTEMSATIGLSECTNPMFQLRWFMREAGLRKGDPRYELNDLAFVASFVTIRGPVMQYLGYCVTAHPRPAPALKALGAAFCVLNWVVVAGMLQFAHRKYAAPLWEWVRGGDPTAKRAPEAWSSGPRESADATLSNGSSSFEEITAHKEFRQTFERMRHHWSFIYSKGIKQK